MGSTISEEKDQSAESASRKIFLVSEFVDESSNSTGYYWSKIARIYATNDYKVHVISTRLSVSGVRNNSLGIKYIPIGSNRPYNKNSVLARVWGQFLLSIAFFVGILRYVGRGDVVISGTNPPSLLFIVFVAQVIRRYRWITIVHDLFPNNLVPAGILSQKSVVYKLLVMLYDQLYKKPDRLVSIGRDMGELLRSKSVPAEKIFYSPHFVCLSEFSALDNRTTEDRTKSTVPVVFSFFGNLGRVQGLANLVTAIEYVDESVAVFNFVGSGACAGLIRELASRKPNCKSLEAIPFADKEAGLRIGDIAIVSLEKGMYGLGVPSKAYFSLAAGMKLFVVSEQNTELSRLIEENPSVGWFCESDNPKEIARTIMKACGEFDGPSHNNSRAVIEKEYSYTKAEGRYIEVFRSIGA